MVCDGHSAARCSAEVGHKDVAAEGGIALAQGSGALNKRST